MSKKNKFKLVFVVLISSLFSNTNAQILNAGFETDSAGVPESWILDGIGSGLTNSHIHSGNQALVVWTWYTHVAGFTINGSASGIPSANLMNYGMPFTSIPLSLEGFYMYDTTGTAGLEDSAQIVVICKRYNSTTNLRDTVAYGLLNLPPTGLSGFVPFSVPIDVKMSGIAPDSIVIGIYSKDPSDFTQTCVGADCMYLYVDDLSLSLPNGTEEISHLFSPINVNPNPVKETLRIVDMDPKVERIEILDFTGKVLISKAVDQQNIQMDVQLFETGMYIIRTFQGSEILSAGRFIKQ